MSFQIQRFTNNCHEAEVRNSKLFVRNDLIIENVLIFSVHSMIEANMK